MPSPAFALRLFGDVSLRHEAGPVEGRASQARRLAFLALLGTQGRSLSRSKILGYLWPDMAESRGRHLLSDTMYVVRSSLGDDALLTVGESVELNPERVWVDVRAYESALKDGRYREAVELYSNPFLDGFYISDAPSFEKWVDLQRQRLARELSVALEALATAAEERGEIQEAVSWRRRQVAKDPFSSLAVRRLMESLVNAGERAAALQVARAHEKLIQSELEASPDAAVTELVESLRADDTGASSFGTPIDSHRNPGERHRGADSDQTESGPLLAEPRTPDAIHSSRGFQSRRRRHALKAGGLILGLLVIGSVVWVGGRLASGTAETPGHGGLPSIAVLPLTVRGEHPDLEFLRDGFVELMSLALDLTPGVRPVHPYSVHKFVQRACSDPADPACGSAVTTRFGAGRFLTGTVVPLDSGGFELWGTLSDAEGIRLRRTTVRGHKSKPISAVLALGRRLEVLPWTTELPDDGATEATPLARAGSSSLSALTDYLEGEAHLRSYRIGKAIQAFRRSVETDSTFSLAWYRLALTAEMLGGSTYWKVADSAAAETLRHADRLPIRQRRVLHALDHLQHGRAERAENELRELLAVYPDDFDAWHLLGELGHHYNPVRGRPPNGEEAFRRVRVLDADFRPALWHLRLEALSRGGIADFDSLTRRFLAIAADAIEAPQDPDEGRDRGIREIEELYARLARADHELAGLVRAEDDAARERWFADLERADGKELAWIAGLHLEHLSWPDRRGDAARIARMLTRSSRAPTERIRGFVILGSIALRAGRWRDAMAALDSVETLDSTHAALWRADWASTSFLPVPAEELSDIRAEAEEILADSTDHPRTALPLGPVGWATRPPGDVRLWGLTSLAMLSVQLDEHEEARTYASRLASTAPVLAEALRLALRADIRRNQGDLHSARAALDSIRYEVRWDYLSANLHPQLFLRAEVLHALGEWEEALPWYSLWTQLTGPRFLGPALYRLGQIHERMGDTAKAMSRYEEFTSLWETADSELRPWVEEARDRIDAMEGA